ncbi:zonula occludens toxin, partial [Acinetobacter baumannii]
LITGTPGAGKTLYAVFLIDNYEKANKRALEFNAIALKQNKELIEKNNLQDYFASYTYFSKITKEYETLCFEPDYFDYFEKKERKETIFLDI